MRAHQRLRSSLILTVALAFAGCHRSTSPARDDALQQSVPSVADSATITNRGEIRASDASTTAVAPAPSTAWCVQPRPLVDARGVDRQGHIIALTRNAVLDETTHAAPVALPTSDPRCRVSHNTVTFLRDDSAVIVSDGRVYVRATPSSRWRMSPICTDLDGQPWTHSAGSPWRVIARRLPTIQPALLQTDDAEGSTGWYASMAMDATLQALALQDDGSYIAMLHGGQVILVDRERSVAGAVAAAQGESFALFTVTRSGVAIARDDGDTARVVLVSADAQQTFRRVRAERPSGAHTERVFASTFGSLVAVTDRGIEVLQEGESRFVQVATWPASSADAGVSQRNAALGLALDGTPVLVTRDAVAAPTCAVLAPAVR